MNNMGRFTPVDGFETTLDLGLGWEYVRVINNSVYLCSLGFGNQGTIDHPEMFLEDIRIGKDFNGKLHIKCLLEMQVSPTDALVNVLSVNVYKPGEIAQPQAQPLTTLANVGNTVQTGVQVGNIINSGEVVPTNIILDTPAGFAEPTVKLVNNAFLGLAENNGLSNIVFIQERSIDQNLQWTQIIDTAGNWDLQQFPTGNLPAQLRGDASIAFANQQVVIDSAGNLTGKSAKWATGGTVSAWSTFSGVGDGTFAHGLGTTPTLILAMQNVVGSQTMGCSNIGATNVTIKTGAGLSWFALAMKIV